MLGQIKRTRQEQLTVAKAQLEQIKTYEQRLNDTINQQENQATALGKTQRQIEDLQFETSLDQQIFEMASRRVQEVEMEGKRPARVSIAYEAELRNIEDKRIKYSAAAMFGMLALGSLLGFLRDQRDKTLETPEDVTINAGMPLIGTTTSSYNIKPAHFAEQLAGDYQIIRTNLDLLSSEGMPKRLAITSPGMREGKTTFAINLATSMAKAGRKVLLIDGDLRKPDVTNMLGIATNGSGGLQDVLAGADFSQVIRSVASSGLDVLPANPAPTADIYELLASSTAVKQIDKLCQKYDHVIIDTPPTLIFPDALIWAKMVDGTILVTFAGKTTTPDLREARDRLAKGRAKILGTVLSNVSAENSYYRVGYAYYSQSGRAARKTGRISKKLLLPLDAQQKGKTDAKS
jgi:capsular exopolysaccharide synthesis family protein